MWITSLISILGMVRDGVVNAQALYLAVQEKRGEIRRQMSDPASTVTLDELQTLCGRVLTHAGMVGDAFIADLAAGR